MNDIQKIKEFFSKPVNEVKTDKFGNHLEPQFKVGDKIKYLGHPGVIKAVNKEMTGTITYTVSYDKGNGKTTASNISNKGGVIKLAEDKKETAVDMAKKQLDALGVKYEMSGNEFRPFKAIYKPTNKPDRWYDEFEDIIHLFNLGSAVKQSMDEAKSEDSYEVVWTDRDYKKHSKVFKNDPKGAPDNAKKKAEAFKKSLEDKDKKSKEGLYRSIDLNEAKSEDAVDTITMDIPLFLRMLEYSREDASQDMDLHDVTEKANKLGKERGILSMEDYEEIVGAAEDIKEVNLKQSKLSSAEYQKAKKLKDFKASDWKWNADEDLYTKVNEGELTEAYVPSNIKEFAKRKGVSSLVNKVAGWAEKVGKSITGGTAIGYNYSTLILDMTYQGSEIRINTDNDTVTLYNEPVYSLNDFKQVYLDNQDESDNDLAERIFETLDKINEELCPAGKAYIKRRKAAGEKSSAYLSGRAVKVCKGQMSGKAKKK